MFLLDIWKYSGHTVLIRVKDQNHVQTTKNSEKIQWKLGMQQFHCFQTDKIQILGSEYLLILTYFQHIKKCNESKQRFYFTFSFFYKKEYGEILLTIHYYKNDHITKISVKNKNFLWNYCSVFYILMVSAQYPRAVSVSMHP